MRTRQTTAILAGLALATVVPWAAGAFDSGSTGADGALNVTNNLTLALPPDGVFNFTTININASVYLSFTPNALNTPVYLLAQGDVTIGRGGSIFVDGQNGSGSMPGVGGPGGFNGGFGSIQTYAPGDGLGPGAGTQGNGWDAAYAYPTTFGNTNLYGNTLCVPMIGGSGGAGHGGGGGGGGGGAILIASSTSISISGSIYARGGSGGNGENHGSGGSIRLVAPTVTGAANNGGPNFLVGAPGGASGGRVRIDTLDRFAWRNLSLTGKWTVGTQMYTGLGDARRVDIIEAAGTSIALGTTNRVSVSLPLGAPTNQVVTLRAAGFTNDVPVTLDIIPENGNSNRYDLVIPANGGNPVTNSVTVVIPVDTVTYVQAWSR
jgi:hypothetical protein